MGFIASTRKHKKYKTTKRTESDTLKNLSEISISVIALQPAPLQEGTRKS